MSGQELYDCAQAQVDELAAAGADLIVCLGHLGIADESAGMRSTDVIDAVDGIDVFIDGHSHDVVETVIEKGEGDDATQTLLVLAGEYGEYLGVVMFDGEEITSGLIPATQFDEDVLALTALLPAHEDEMVAAEVNSVNDAIIGGTFPCLSPRPKFCLTASVHPAFAPRRNQSG